MFLSLFSACRAIAADSRRAHALLITVALVQAVVYAVAGVLVSSVVSALVAAAWCVAAWRLGRRAA